MNALYQIPDAYDILAADRAAVVASMPATDAAPFYSVQDVMNRAAFVRNDLETLHAAGGVQQLAMNVTIDGSVYTVVCKRGADGLEWSASCPPRRHQFAAVIIDAVKRRIEENRKTEGMVN